jgi:16S rRNA G966 N2-methylase RsmD
VTYVPDLATNLLYYGDNLDILRRYLPDATVDLVYLDPPFATDAQLGAFEDTGHALAIDLRLIRRAGPT